MEYANINKDDICIITLLFINKYNFLMFSFGFMNSYLIQQSTKLILYIRYNNILLRMNTNNIVLRKVHPNYY